MPSRHTGEFLQALIQATDYGILMTDLQGTDLLCNDRFAVLFGIDPAIVGVLPREEMRRIALSRVKDPQEFSQVIERVYQNPTLVQEDEIEVSLPASRIMRRHTAPVYGEAGDIVGRIWTFLDITETRRLQAQVQQHARQLEQRLEMQAAELRQAQQALLETAQLRAVGTLATGIAHDLRNILTSLRLEEPETSKQGGSPYLAAQIDRLYTLTHSLLALSSDSNTLAGPVDIEEVICFVFQLVRGQAVIDGIQLIVQADPGVPPVVGSSRRLEHLLINLILNSLNAMSATGGELTVRVKQKGSFVCVRVEDTGPGIPPEHLSDLFAPFFTTRSNRTGLGLFSARRIVEEHSGTISIANRVEGGAVVTIELPIAIESALSSEATL